MERALVSLQKRRPDLKLGPRARVPEEEAAALVLDQLTYTCGVVARLRADVTDYVIAARSAGASWAKIGPALGESPQTAFNRYKRHDEPDRHRQTGRRRTV